MKNGGIRNWPEEERPRERLLRYGAESMSTSHLVAIILRTGNRDRSAYALARELLARFNNLRSMEEAPLADFLEIKGVGEVKVAQLKAAFELGRRLIQGCREDPMKKPCFRNSRDVYDYYQPRLFGLRKERFLCILLDAKNRVFKEVVVSEGTHTSSLVHPREVFREAIREAAASVLFTHNHPSGDPTPSRDDIEITRRLVETGEIVGIKVLDHVIVADGGYASVIHPNS
jgi:DNA repair protein RadC